MGVTNFNKNVKFIKNKKMKKPISEQTSIRSLRSGVSLLMWCMDEWKFCGGFDFRWRSL